MCVNLDLPDKLMLDIAFDQLRFEKNLINDKMFAVFFSP
jgi:hypothetical protein